jgi:hypothetical protein
MVEQEARMNWKPRMSKAEAEEYTRDSYYERQDFYHGTSAENADGIETVGAKWGRNSENSYGDGFYLTPDRLNAVEYAKDSNNPTILFCRVRCRNPKIFQNGTDFYEFLARYDIPSDENDAGFSTRILTREGYDAIEVRGIQTLVIILNPQQIAVFDRESTT